MKTVQSENLSENNAFERIEICYLSLKIYDNVYFK